MMRPITITVGMVTAALAAVDEHDVPLSSSRRRDVTKMIQAALDWNMPLDPHSPETRHFLQAIRIRLEQLYEEHPSDPALREQISDEVDWIDSKVGMAVPIIHNENCDSTDDPL